MPTFRELLSSLEAQEGLPPGLLTAVAQTESSFNPTAVSPKGAQGLFQFMPDTAKQYGVDPFNPVSSAIGAAKMFGDLNRKYQGDMPSMLAGYNWGQGNVDRKGLAKAPKETRNYIDKILSAVSPISSAQASEEPYIPTREEFLQMKRSGQIAPQPQRIPTREEFLRMKRAEQETAQQLPPIANSTGPQAGQIQQQASRKIPTRAEFLQMKRLGIAPRPEDQFGVAGMQVNDIAQDIPTREEFMRMKQAGTLPQQSVTGQIGNQPSSHGQTTLDYLKNVGLGIAARGNQAMTALNPFATQEDYDRIAAEKNWVEQNSGAGLGEVLADIAITAPAGGVGSLAGRALGTGALEGLTTPGGTIDKIKQAGYMALSAGLGESAANLVGRALHPFRGATDTKSLANVADKLGIPLSAANRTGNKALQSLDAGLDWMVGSSKPQAAAKKAQREAWQQQVLGQAGEYADTASPEVMGAMKSRLNSVYNDIASRNVINIDGALKADLKAIGDKYLTRLPTAQKGIVKSYLKDFTKMEKLPASAYQDARSMLDKQARGYANSDPATSHALRSIRDAMDKAMNRSVSPEDAAALMQANKEWGIMRTIEKAADPLSGQISPDKFLNELAKRNPNSMIYGKGDQTLNELARVGKEFVSKKVPDSGTAQRSYMTNLISNPLSALGGISGYYGSDGDIGAVLPGMMAGRMLGSFLVPKLASRMMWSPNGYLSKGLIDLTEGARAQILSEMGRQGGIAAQHVLTARPTRKQENAR